MLAVRISTLLLLLFGSISYATPIITEKTTHYKINGNSAQELRNQMSMLGPTDIATERYDASTHWYIKWQYHFEPVGSQCHLTKIDVNVDVLYRFPEWPEDVSTNVSLRNHWNTYLQHLKIHEKGHAENGIEAARTIERALIDLPAMQSCDALVNTADNIAHKIIALHNTKDIHYEDETNHGETQGATFP
jgi:predicted secreted Zn-dependent protease